MAKGDQSLHVILLERGYFSGGVHPVLACDDAAFAAGVASACQARFRERGEPIRSRVVEVPVLRLGDANDGAVLAQAIERAVAVGTRPIGGR